MVIPSHSFHPLMVTQSMDCFLTNTSSLPTHPYILPATSCLPRDCCTSPPFCLSPAFPEAPPKIWHPPRQHTTPPTPLLTHPTSAPSQPTHTSMMCPTPHPPHSHSHSRTPDPHDSNDCTLEVLKWCRVRAHA